MHRETRVNMSVHTLPPVRSLIFISDVNPGRNILPYSTFRLNVEKSPNFITFTFAETFMRGSFGESRERVPCIKKPSRTYRSVARLNGNTVKELFCTFNVVQKERKN